MNELSCNIILDKNNRELNLKGEVTFPVGIYNDYLEIEPVPYHWHEEVELIVVISGQMELVVELEQIILSEGQSVFINSGRLHSCSSCKGSNCIIKSLVFHSKFVYGDTDSVLYDKYIRVLLKETSMNFLLLDKNFCNTTLETYNLFEHKNFAYEFEVREKLTNILLHIFNQNDRHPQISDNKTIKMINRCKNMMNYIHKNYNNNISLLEIASSANIKESECLRCFKNVLNISPIKYLKKYRLERARMLLTISTQPIIEIAMECGFAEMSYFSKSFRENYGITPTEYRNIQNKK